MAKKLQDPVLCDAIERSRKAYKKSPKSALKPGKPNSVADFVTYPRGILKEFMGKYSKNIEINDEILQVIPDKFKQNVSSYQLHNNQLSLIINNAAAATQLRFIKTELLNQLRQNGLWEISSITIKVGPA